MPAGATVDGKLIALEKLVTITPAKDTGEVTMQARLRIDGSEYRFQPLFGEQVANVL